MYTKNHHVFKFLIAKLIFRLYCVPGENDKNMKRIHELYAEESMGVGYNTFRSYVNKPDSETEGLELHDFTVAALRMLGYFRELVNLGITIGDFSNLTNDEIDIRLAKLLRRRAEMREQEKERTEKSRAEVKIPEEQL